MRAILALGAATFTSAEALAQAPVAAPAPAPKPWSFQARFEQMADTNFRFAPDGDGGAVERLDATLGRLVRGAKGQLTLRLQGGGRIYPTEQGLNSLRWSALANGRRRLSSRAEVFGGGSFLSSYNAESPLLAETGLLTSFSETHTAQAEGGVAYSLGQQSMLNVELGYQGLSFASSQLVDGSVLSVTSTLQRTLSTSDTGFFAYSYQRSATADRNGETHTVSARVTHRLQRLTLDGSLGAALVAADGVSKLRPQGAAGLALQVGRGTVQAGYSRTAGYAFGFGRERLADNFTAGYLLPVGRRVQLRASLLHGRSNDPLDDAFHYTITSASPGIALVLSPQFTLEGAYTYLRGTSAGPSPAIRQSVSIAVSYGRSWE